MNYIDSSLKVVGTRPIRPDGVDKVTGRAVFAADTRASGMLWGKIKRSPHAHARIISIDTSKAAALPGVKAVVTAEDFPVIASEEAFMGEGPMNFRDLSLNIMARDKALYEGHAVAAVAATTQAIADEALDLIDVQYEVLPFVIDVEAAMAPDAPILHDDLFTVGVIAGAGPSRPTSPRSSPSRRAISKQASRRQRSSSKAATPRSRCIRHTSSRMPASQPIRRMGRSPSTPPARVIS